MAMIALVGTSVEHKYGSKSLFCYMLLNAVLTGLIQGIFFNDALIGASGIVFMCIILSGFSTAKENKIPMTLVVVALCYLGNEVITAINIEDDVSQFAHIFGGLLGLVIGIVNTFINKKRTKNNT
jgi:membrane associated rhomboid family serine protease